MSEEKKINKNDYKNVTLRPFSYLMPSLGNTYIWIFIMLLPQIAMLLITKSFASIVVLCSTLCASFLAEGIYKFIDRSYSFSWVTSAIQGITIGLLLPSSYPFVSVFFITLGSLIFAKYAFGSYTNSWINPVAITVAVAYFLNMSSFPGFLITKEYLQSKNTALILIQNGAFPILSSDSEVTSFLNKTIFKIFGINIPEGYVSLLWDCHSIIPAFRFNLLTLISSIVLISLNMIDFLIPSCFILIYAILIRFLGPVFVQGPFMQGDVILALLTSGTLFSTLFVLQYNGTTPITLAGKIIYGVLAGFIAFLIMGSGTSSVGYVFTVLIMNIISPMIQVVESRQAKHTIEKVLVPRIRQISEVING